MEKHSLSSWINNRGNAPVQSDLAILWYRQPWTMQALIEQAVKALKSINPY